MRGLLAIAAAVTVVGWGSSASTSGGASTDHGDTPLNTLDTPCDGVKPPANYDNGAASELSAEVERPSSAIATW